MKRTVKNSYEKRGSLINEYVLELTKTNQLHCTKQNKKQKQKNRNIQEQEQNEI